MSVTIYVPRDAAALALGAEKVAEAVTQEIAARGIDAKIVRNGSRGMFWLEPLVEVEVSGKRIGYGPVKVKDVAALFDAGLVNGGDHALCLGGGRRPPIPQGTDPPDLRPLRRHRSAFSERL